MNFVSTTLVGNAAGAALRTQTTSRPDRFGNFMRPPVYGGGASAGLAAESPQLIGEDSRNSLGVAPVDRTERGVEGRLGVETRVHGDGEHVRPAIPQQPLGMLDPMAIHQLVKAG